MSKLTFIQKSHHSARTAFGVLTVAAFSLYAANMMIEKGLPLPLHRVDPVSKLLATPEVVCTRNPRPLSRIPDGDRVYHAFDNVLLIVFFSHARYDANLDFYRLTYEEFFPNVSYTRVTAYR